MATNARHLFWRIPLTIAACVAGSLIVVWCVSQMLGFAMTPAVVAALSAVMGAAAIAAELRSNRKWTRNSSAQ
jgi:ABC-type spermidine/putrescine transport system permease subunit I